jgi:hypothetical protein
MQLARALPHSNLIWDFDGFGLRCLQLNTLNNYSVAADRVVVAAELDKFSRNMNNPAVGSRLAHSVLEASRRDNGDREGPFKSSYAARPEYGAALDG